MHHVDKVRPVWLLAVLLLIAVPGRALADAPAEVEPVEFTEQTLDNGLRVIYAPLHQAPVVHVRILYHVGSRDERPDRQGFAHLFEHMMFRGSRHVAPEQHMRLIGMVGGRSNAFTSFDQTVYVNTLPSNHLEMALYLEADRMASFKLSEEIYETERMVVMEEWRIRQNRPYGNFWEDFLRTAFTEHSYRWPPIGNMEHLRAAEVGELQEFFNTYYVPNNAVMVIAGDFDVDQTRDMVERYFSWIPPGDEIDRDIPAEPEQTEPRRLDVAYRVSHARVAVGWRVPEYRSEDHDALTLLSVIMGQGRSSRLDQLLVNVEEPLCVDVFATHWQLEDHGFFAVVGTVLEGRDPADVERILNEAIRDVRENGVTGEELEKARTIRRVGIIRDRETAESLANQLGREALFGRDPHRVNTRLERLEAVTPEEIQAVAQRLFDPQRTVTMRVDPDPEAEIAPLFPVAQEAAAEADEVPATIPEPRITDFPEDYPTRPPLADARDIPEFEKGEEIEVNGVLVIVMTDDRLPLVNWNLTMRAGSHNDPPGREGLAELTSELIRRGAGDLTYTELNEDLESRGISLRVSDGGDYTRVSGSATTDQLEHALMRTRQVLREPRFPADEFARLREQRLNQLRLDRDNPREVAAIELDAALWGDSPLGRVPAPESVAAIELDEIEAFYQRIYRPTDAILMLSGDLSVEQGRALAERLLDGWEPAPRPTVDYAFGPAPEQRRIILVDRPEGRQSTVRIGIRAYDIHSDEKFAGAVANQVLTAGIDARLGRYVRAERGLAYSVWSLFRPDRQAGRFTGAVDTAVESTADAVEAMFEVFDGMRVEEVTDDEMHEARLRLTGSMVMQMQTVEQQARYRVEGILNDYPLDYYDRYPERIAEIEKSEVREVMQRYVDPDRMVVVVVAPAELVREQLERLGEVEVVPMPARRE